MLYQITSLAVRTGTPKALPTISDWVMNAPYRGKLLAVWESEFGVLGQVLVLHGYDGLETMQRDRETVAQSPDRYGIGDGLADVSTRSYKPFSIFGDLKPGEFGPVFEVRSYLLRVGALSELMERWEKALPARMALSKPLIVMYSMEGSGPSLVHIWPYASLEAREKIRAQAEDQGIWPVKGMPGTVLARQSEIFLPGLKSPIH